MNIREAMERHDLLVQTMRNTLIELGYPRKSIVTDQEIRLEGQKFSGDLLVFGSDSRSVLLVFEVKIAPHEADRAFVAGKRSLAKLTGRFPCFVMTQQADEYVVADAREQAPKWVSISDKDALLELLGDYNINSNTRIAARKRDVDKKIGEDSRYYFAWIGGSGALMSLLGFILEACALPITRKPYLLFMGVLVLCSTFAGISVHARIDDRGAEVSVGKLNEAARLARAKQELGEE